jgi:hypothetical protein
MGKVDCSKHGEIPGQTLCPCLVQDFRNGVMDKEEITHVWLFEKDMYLALKKKRCPRSPKCRTDEDNVLDDKSLDGYGPVCRICLSSQIDIQELTERRAQ